MKTGHPVFEIDQEKGYPIFTLKDSGEVEKGADFSNQVTAPCKVTGFYFFSFRKLRETDQVATEKIYFGLIRRKGEEKWHKVILAPSCEEPDHCIVVHRNQKNLIRVVFVPLNRTFYYNDRKYGFDGRTLKEVKQ